MRPTIARLLNALRRRAPDAPPTLAATVRCLWDAGATLGENPRWDAGTQSVYWADLRAGTLHRYRMPDGARASWPLGPEIGAIALGPDGRVMVALGDALSWFDPATGALAPWTTVPALDAARCRFNDAAWAPDGTLWLASMDRAGREPLGALHRVDGAGRATTIARGYPIANGPAFDGARGRAYVADTTRGTVYALPIDAPTARRPFAQLRDEDGHPDGMAVDADGTLLIAHYGGACLTRWTPDGRCTGRIAMPVRNPTAVAIVPGPGDERTLVVTSARDDAGAGGGLYAVTGIAAG